MDLSSVCCSPSRWLSRGNAGVDVINMKPGKKFGVQNEICCRAFECEIQKRVIMYFLYSFFLLTSFFFFCICFQF